MNKEALGNLKGLSQNGEQTDFSENLRASPFKKDPPIYITFSQIHLAGQYLFKKQEYVGHGFRPNLNFSDPIHLN
jgi:hypothetical protein